MSQSKGLAMQEKKGEASDFSVASMDEWSTEKVVRLLCFSYVVLR